MNVSIFLTRGLKFSASSEDGCLINSGCFKFVSHCSGIFAVHFSNKVSSNVFSNDIKFSNLRKTSPAPVVFTILKIVTKKKKKENETSYVEAKLITDFCIRISSNNSSFPAKL